MLKSGHFRWEKNLIIIYDLSVNYIKWFQQTNKNRHFFSISGFISSPPTCSHHSTGVRGAWCCSKVHIDVSHKYTRRGGVGGDTVMQLMKVLTNKDIKSRVGLDNVWVEQGCENFLTLRRVVPSLAALAGKVGELEEMLGKLNGLELFMKTYFHRHLE